MIASGESFRYFEDLVKQHRRVCADSADYGVFLSEKEMDKARTAIRELMKTYKVKVDKWGDWNSRRRVHGSETRFFIPIELDDQNPSMDNGFFTEISYTWDSRLKKHFMSVDINRKSFPRDSKEWGFKSS